jgi:hypothetical protein
VFDGIYNFAGWKVGEYKALTEEFEEKEFKFIAFSISGTRAAIQYTK